MSFTSAPLPKMSKVNFNPLSNMKTLATEDIQANNVKSDNYAHKQKRSKCKQNGPEQNQRDRQTNEKNDQSLEKEPPKGNILHVSNICSKLHYQKIKRGLFDVFSVYGRIYDILIKTKQSGQHFAFIDYDNIKDAQKAWRASKCQGLKLEGRALYVNYCQDPKKNIDRKDQKCYLCHEAGHKAIKCPVKPEMIKKKPKKLEQAPYKSDQDETNYVEVPAKNTKNSQKIQQTNNQSEGSQSSDEQECRSKKRDKDYLRFLKLKKKLLENKLNKKVKKSKKKKN